MPREMDRTPERALAYVKELADGGDTASIAGMSSAVQDPNGEWQGGHAVLPDWSGWFFSLNPDPDLAASPPYGLTQGQRRLRTIDYAICRAREQRRPWRILREDAQMCSAATLSCPARAGAGPRPCG
jgi:hypothetical protein